MVDRKYLDAKGYLYAAEMTDLLTTAVDRAHWDAVLIPELGPLARLFAHLAKVRWVYRDALLAGYASFPGTPVPRGTDLEAELIRSREALADAFANPKIDRVKWGDCYLGLYEVYAAAVQHEGIHQGQWYVGLKQAGLWVPKQWQSDWRLG